MTFIREVVATNYSKMRGKSMTFKTKMATAAAIAAVVALSLAGCAAGATTEAPSEEAAAAGNKICVYTHGDGGTFWSVFQKGAEAAAAELNVTLDYQGSTNDSAKQAQTIAAGVTAGCEGIAASAPDAAAIKDAMLAAADAGIPTVTANSGSDVFAELGAFTHVGQDEIVAGREAGKKFNEMGLKNILCPIQEAANSGLTLRCQGAAETFTGTVANFNLDGGLADLTGAEAKLSAALTADPTIDGIFALNADIATGAALPAATASGRDIMIGTIDMSADALEAIKAGTIAFAVDQQQYAQGYMAVVLLNLAINNGNKLGGGVPIYSGPGFVTSDNVDAVMALVAAGTR
jgi:simple sugar transport system substrate-binding protein